MSDSFTTWLLDHIAFTQGLHPRHLEQLAAIATPARWEAGDIVFREGDADDTLYLIDEGCIALEAAVPGKEPVRILTVGSGEVFGWSSVFYQRPKTASARALGSTRGLALDSTKLRALCDSDPQLGYDVTRRLLQVVSDRIKAHRKQMVESTGG